MSTEATPSTPTKPLPSTVEVRIPTPSYATGQDGRQWAKLLTSVSERAKTGHDWAGLWLDTGRLVDLPIGSMVATGGSTGSRKHPTKVATLYVVDPDGDLIQIMHVEHDEWAVEMRVKAREYLAMDPLQRPIIACERKAKWYREEATPETEGSYDQTRILKIIASGGYSYSSIGNESSPVSQAYDVGGCLPSNTPKHAATRAEMLAKGLANARTELLTIEAKIAEERAELLSQAEEWERHAERFRTMLMPTPTPMPDPSPEPTTAPAPTPPVAATQERGEQGSPVPPLFTVEVDQGRVIINFNPTDRQRVPFESTDGYTASLTTSEARHLAQMISEVTERSGI